MAEISSTQVLAPHIAIRKLIPVKLDLSEGDSDLDNEESSGSDVPHKQEDPEGDQNADSKADRKEDVAADQDDDAKSDQHGDEDVRKYEDSDLQRTVDVYSLRDSTILDWPRCVQMIVSELENRVKGDTCQLLVNDFSTTDVVSRTTSQIVLMDTMKHFFEYRMTFECGIPSVTLHGTLRDWERLVEKARALRALRIGLDWWLDQLGPVLEKLVETYWGNVDEDWWSRVIRSEQSYGSGYTPEYITGWVCTFFPYDRRGESVYRRSNSISGDNLPKGLVECPFTLDGCGKCLLVAGSCAVTVTEDGGVMPCIGWLVKRAPSKE